MRSISTNKKTAATICSVVMILVCPTQLWADTVQLNRVFVSATGNAQSIDDVQASVQVLEREDIDQYAGHSVAEVLQQATSIQTRNSGANSSISIRGFNSNQSLVLINSQRRTGNYGNHNPSQINMHDIDRIEIVRGPMSSLYGADALGGVINIIKKHPGQGAPVSVQMTAGTAQEGRETVHSGINLNAGSAQLGHTLSLEQDYRKPFRHDDSVADDLGRLDTRSAAYRGRWAPDELQSLEWTLELFDRNNDRDAIYQPRIGQPYTYNNYEEERRTFYGLNYQRLLGAGELTLRTSLGESDGQTNRSYPTTLQENTLYKQYQTTAIYQWSAHRTHQATVGMGHIRDELSLTIISRNAARNNSFLLAQDEWEINEQWTLVAGARFDRLDDFYNATTPRISLGWSHSDSRARLSYGEGFRAPSLTEQYASFTRGPTSLIQGNPNLKPESSTSWEIMLGHKLHALDVELTAHHSDVDDLINTRIVGTVPGSIPARSIHEYHNVKQAQLRGAELNSTWHSTERLDFTLSYEFLEAIDAATDERLTGRARNTYRLQTNYHLDQWTVSLRAKQVNGFYSTEGSCRGNCPAYDSHYGAADINLQYQASPKAELFLGVNNIFARTEPSNFSSMGNEQNDPSARYFYTGARVSF